jgi:HD superfamily phosphohydrolase
LVWTEHSLRLRPGRIDDVFCRNSRESIRRYNKSGIDVKDVKDLILGHGPLDKPFLISLINSQLDVDKFDYLLRDSHYAGV